MGGCPAAAEFCLDANGDAVRHRKPLLASMSVLLATFILSPAAGHPVLALRTADISNDQPTLDFPNTITFHVNITSPINITSVTLEYGDQEQTCGDVLAEAYPQITPGTTVGAAWAWDMRQSDSLPPGAQIWWRWRFTDANNQEIVTDQKTVTWLDSGHTWQTLNQGDIRLHWYQNSQSFAQDLLNTAYNGLARLEADAGLSTDQPIDLYIYANTQNMKDAILYEPAWTGGEAFPEHNIVIIGIGPSDLTWGRRAVVHELTHVLVGHLTFTCLGGVPTWLNEGLAVYSEGDLVPASQTQLDDAIHNDTLLSVRSLSGQFSEVADKANLSYSESYSIVKFLLKSYGRAKMTTLLLALRDGNTPDEALTTVYGFNIDGLEDAWRADVGAKPRPAGALPTAAATPTFVPTIVPISGGAPSFLPTPFQFPTPAPAAAPSSGPPLSLTLMLAFTCCGLGLVVGVIVIGFLVSRENRKRMTNEKGA
jgi:hypothetical protein